MPCPRCAGTRVTASGCAEPPVSAPRCPTGNDEASPLATRSARASLTDRGGRARMHAGCGCALSVSCPVRAARFSHLQGGARGLPVLIIHSQSADCARRRPAPLALRDCGAGPAGRGGDGSADLPQQSPDPSDRAAPCNRPHTGRCARQRRALGALRDCGSQGPAGRRGDGGADPPRQPSGPADRAAPCNEPHPGRWPVDQPGSSAPPAYCDCRPGMRGRRICRNPPPGPRR